MTSPNGTDGTPSTPTPYTPTPTALRTVSRELTEVRGELQTERQKRIEAEDERFEALSHNAHMAFDAVRYRGQIERLQTEITTLRESHTTCWSAREVWLYMVLVAIVAYLLVAIVVPVIVLGVSA